MPVDDRFQNQPWYVRLWRRRILLRVPHRAVETWRYARAMGKPMRFKNCWGFELGSAHHRMKWYYTADEVFRDHALR
jgi:hypothetical protein